MVALECAMAGKGDAVVVAAGEYSFSVQVPRGTHTDVAALDQAAEQIGVTAGAHGDGAAAAAVAGDHAMTAGALARGAVRRHSLGYLVGTHTRHGPGLVRAFVAAVLLIRADAAVLVHGPVHDSLLEGRVAAAAGEPCAAGWSVAPELRGPETGGHAASSALELS